MLSKREIEWLASWKAQVASLLETNRKMQSDLSDQLNLLDAEKRRLDKRFAHIHGLLVVDGYDTSDSGKAHLARQNLSKRVDEQDENDMGGEG